MITQAQKAALAAAGYTIEDMQKEWGDQYEGQYRWMNASHEQDGGDGFGVIQYSEGDAWDDALQFQEEQLGIPVFTPETDCDFGVHSWAGEIGKLPASTPCAHCGELYGNPN